MPKDRLLDYFFLQIRNLWRVDGLYFLGIEQRFGTEAAAEVDAGVWETMAKIEAKSLQKMLQIDENPNVSAIMKLLRFSSWALDQPFKTVETGEKHGTLSVSRCRTQETRMILKGEPDQELLDSLFKKLRGMYPTRSATSFQILTRNLRAIVDVRNGSSE
jgi:hypothetical protein